MYKKPPKEKQFKKGQSGNPNGRPQNSLSLKTILKRELQNIPPEYKTTKERRQYADLLVKKMLHKAIIGGDVAMIRLIWNYIEGIPKESSVVSVRLPTPILSSLRNLKDDKQRETEQ